MGYCDHTDAELFALTRQRRLESELRRAAEEHARKHAEYEARYGPTMVFDRRIPVRTQIGEARYHAIVAAQDNRCYLCPESFTDDDPPTLDHVWPRTRGGRHADNLLAAHAACNVRKAGRKPTAAEMAYLRTVNARVAELLTIRATPTP